MRKITIHVDPRDADHYADIVNAVWAQMNATGCDFTVTPDAEADVAELDKRWDDYSTVSWSAGGRRGTPQAIAATSARNNADPTE
ncbi:hypothetical protein [Micromonospora auratinigra]|uniref:Uncharacterized protein n=1 Tax=Micromonospora auratinigra TaxID=261654 RepID=A0A1A8Z9Q3_9ACTN|nr:hypothetical protein [Micromonospora auratinigra]SBT40692.1 hypothetical protein GA0070611_1349 [Micromonospora auratinigra]